MPTNSAEYQRAYRERKKAELAVKVEAARERQLPAKPAASIHAQCDAKIAELEARNRRLQETITFLDNGGNDAAREAFAAATVHLLPEEVAILGGTEAPLSGTPEKAVPPSRPSFLAAPDEDCVCGHDNHAYHLTGSCGAWVSLNGKRQRCPCGSFQADLGFD